MTNLIILNSGIKCLVLECIIITYSGLEQLNPYCLLFRSNNHTCRMPLPAPNKNRCYFAHLQGSEHSSGIRPNDDEIVQVRAMIVRTNTGQITFITCCVVVTFLLLIFVGLPFYFIQQRYLCN